MLEGGRAELRGGPGRYRRPAALRLSLLLHVVAPLALLARPALWPWALGLVVMDHLFLVAASLLPRSALVGDNLTRLPGSERPAVGLTFDDGPDPACTPAVLDLLEAAGARATFFCVGRKAAAHPELVRDIAARGHGLGNHTFDHRWAFCMLPPWAMRREIARTQHVLSELGGAAPRYFRAPAGLRSPWLGGLLAGLGLRLVSWTRRGFDTVSRDPGAVLRRLTRGLAAGDLLLLHDGDAAVAESGRPVVLEVLPRLLEEVARRGLEVVALPELEVGG